MSNLTFTKIDQGIKDRKRLHLTFLKKRHDLYPLPGTGGKNRTSPSSRKFDKCKYNYLNLFILYKIFAQKLIIGRT